MSLILVCDKFPFKIGGKNKGNLLPSINLIKLIPFLQSFVFYVIYFKKKNCKKNPVKKYTAKKICKNISRIKPLFGNKISHLSKL